AGSWPGSTWPGPTSGSSSSSTASTTRASPCTTPTARQRSWPPPAGCADASPGRRCRGHHGRPLAGWLRSSTRLVVDRWSLRDAALESCVSSHLSPRVQVTFDCAEPVALARFWAEVLGYPPPDVEGFRERLRAAGEPEENLDNWALIRADDDQ